MNYEITGEIAIINEIEKLTDTFRKREFVLMIREEVNGNVYENAIKMQFVGDRVNKLNTYNVGDMVKVNFNLRGRIYEKDGKQMAITNLEAWRIASAPAQATQPAAPQQQQAAAQPMMWGPDGYQTVTYYQQRGFAAYAPQPGATMQPQPAPAPQPTYYQAPAPQPQPQPAPAPYTPNADDLPF